MWRAVACALSLLLCWVAVADAHPTPDDVDGDEVLNVNDNCPNHPNGSQRNTDRELPGGDAAGDACDDDDDADGAPDTSDNCRIVPNPGQENSDGDAYGDACPPVDTDGDGVVDPDDNAPRPTVSCASSFNPGQEDLDGDDVGDVCDRDDDADKYDDGYDNCPRVWNPDQGDADGDGIGSACDAAEPLPSPPGPGSGSGPRPGGSTAPAQNGGSPTDPAGAPGAATVRDRKAPIVRIKGSRRFSLRSGTRAFVAPVSCSERCAIDVRLRVGRTLVASGAWSLGGPATAFVFCDFRRRPRAGQRAALEVIARDAAGNRRVVRRTIVFTR